MVLNHAGCLSVAAGSGEVNVASLQARRFDEPAKVMLAMTHELLGGNPVVQPLL